MENTIFAYIPSLLLGTGETLAIAAFSMIFGVLLGFVFSLGLLSKKSWLSNALSVVYTAIQGLPEILILLFAYFEIPQAFSFMLGHPVEMSPWAIGICTLALICGSYAAKIFYGAFLNIPQGQWESALVLGLKSHQRMQHILLPQIIKKSLPGIRNLWLIILKETALVSLIGASDLMSRSKIAIGNTEKPFTFYFIAALIYLSLALISEKILKGGSKEPC